MTSLRVFHGAGVRAGPTRAEVSQDAVSHDPMSQAARRLRRHTRVLLVSSLVTLAAVLAGWVIFTPCAARLVTSMYRANRFPC